MPRRTIIYIHGQSCSPGTSDKLEGRLRQAVEERGDAVVGNFAEHDAQGRRKTGWKASLANLDGVDQIAVVSAGDLPGRTVNDLLRLLETLRDHGIDLFLMTENIDTASGSAAILDLISAYRRTKLSQAIKRGQERCGKRIGRPPIPLGVVVRIRACLQQGGGIRATAKKFGVSPASVINVRRSATSDQQAA